MRTLLAILLFPFSLFASDYLTISDIAPLEGRLQCHISDGYRWILLEHLGGDSIEQWKVGDHVFYWKMPGYANEEYRLFNLDTFGCYRVLYRY